MFPLHRNTLIVLSVVLAHVATLWALQSGLLRRAVEVIVPAQVLSEFIAPPAPPSPPPTAPTLPPPVAPRSPVTPPVPASITAPVTDAPNAVVAPAPSAPPAPPMATTAPPAATRGSPVLEPPSSDAQYLRNPKPVYPALSKRLGEQGKVVIRVLIGADGSAQKAEIQQSSGFDRLDQAALNTVLGWRFVPGKRGGVPEAMWFSVPINFLLE
jgi:protein TonB